MAAADYGGVGIDRMDRVVMLGLEQGYAARTAVCRQSSAGYQGQRQQLAKLES
jgi:hypothetical protein